MLAKVLSSAILGIDAILVDVEVDIAQGLRDVEGMRIESLRTILSRV